MNDWSRYGRKAGTSAGYSRFAPINSAVGGVQRRDRLPHPNNELPGSAGGNDYRRTPGAGFTERLPDLTTRDEIERDHTRRGFPANRRNQQVAIDQR